MRTFVSALLICLIVVTISLTSIPQVAAQTEEDSSVYDYEIISVTQTGADQITVKVQARYCPACNPNSASNPGCTEFTHGYPPPYHPYNYWCGGSTDGRYVAVRIKDSTGTVLGTQKLVCNPTNWPLNAILTRDFVFSGVLLMTGSTVIAEADVYCSWCAHWYPTPISVEIAPLTVCIDPGHDSISKPLEYAINKGVADKLMSQLVSKGIGVNFTDASDDPSARASYTNNLKPDIFVSLHCNALEGFDSDGKPIGTVRGSEVWVFDDTDSSEQAINEYDLAIRTLANLIVEVESQLRQGDYAIWKEKESPWPGGIPILRGVTVCPAVLLEMEFYDYGEPVEYKGVTYPNMLVLMNTEIWRENAAKGIANGIIGYFQDRGLTIATKSPVDIMVTDPDGLTVCKQFNEIPGASYSEVDIDGDGDLDDQIRIPDRKIGYYILTVIPEVGALPTDTYTLQVWLFGIPIVVAENVSISDIPSEPYVIESTDTGIVLLVIEATVRIEPETLNLNSKGVLTAFITLPEGYDVAEIDINTVVCEGASAIRGTVSEEDTEVFIAKFDRQNLVGLTTGDEVTLKVTGQLNDGTQFEGTDMIRVTNK